MLELLKRKDAGQVLFEIYKNKNVKDINESMNLVQKGLFTFDFTYLELLLSLKQSFTGFQELLGRNDAAIELLKLYKLMKPEEIVHAANDTLRGDFSFHFVEIEILLAQEEIINSLSTDIEAKLLKEAALKYEQKKATGEFSSFSLSPSMLVAGRILDKKGRLQNLKTSYTNNELQNFLSKGLADNPRLLEQILALSKN